MISLLVMLPSLAFAQESAITGSNKQLNQQEINDLRNDVGFTQEDFDNVPPEIARELLKQGAKKLTNGKVEKHTFNEGVTTSKLATTESLSPSDIALYGSAYSVTSDKPGYKKVYLYGSFQWDNAPFWILVDKVSIGYPSTNKFFYATKNGQILGHYNELWYKDANTGNTVFNNSTTPSDADPATGVAASFDLVNSQHQGGHLSQYVYVSSSETGTSNLLIRYGHKTISGSPSVDIYPTFGLSVSPTTTTETADYWLTINW